MKKRKNVWFIRIRGSFLPASAMGWLTFVPFTALLIASAIHAYTYASNTVDFLLTVFVYWTAAAVVMTWIATQKS